VPVTLDHLLEQQQQQQQQYLLLLLLLSCWQGQVSVPQGSS
jgi:hypothetical protein